MGMYPPVGIMTRTPETATEGLGVGSSPKNGASNGN